MWACPPTASLCQGCNTPGVSHSALRECDQWSDSADAGLCLHLQASQMIRKGKGWTNGRSDFEIWRFWSLQRRSWKRHFFSRKKNHREQAEFGWIVSPGRGRRQREWEWREWRSGGHSRPSGPPAGHSVIHKMRPFSQTTLYRLLSCHSYMQLGRESSVPSAFRWKQFFSRKFRSPGAVSFSSSPSTQMLRTSAPLFCLVGFLMFTDVLSLWKNRPFTSLSTPQWGRPSIIQQRARGFARPWPCPKALLETSRPWEWGSVWGYGRRVGG